MEQKANRTTISCIPDVDFLNFDSEAVGYRCLSELKIGVLGIGHIGQSIAKVFSGFFLRLTTIVSIHFIVQSSAVLSWDW